MIIKTKSTPLINNSMINLPKEITDLENYNSDKVHIMIKSQSDIFDWQTELTFNELEEHAKTGKKVILVSIDQTSAYPESITQFSESDNYLLLRDLCVKYPNILMFFMSSNRLNPMFGLHPNIHFYYIPELNGWYWPLYKDTHLNLDAPVTKKFLSLNKRGDVWRQFLYKLFHNRDLLKDSYFSYHCEFDNNIDLNHHGKWKHNADFLDDWAHNYYESMVDTLWPKSKFIELKNDKLFEKYKGWDGPGENDPTWLAENYMYDDTFCSVVIETSPTNDNVNFSEKTFRCIALGHPYIVLGAYGTLQYLREIGLDTYDDIFDTSYDDIKDDFKRVAKFFESVEKIAKMSLSEMNELKLSMKDRLLANREKYKQFHSYYDPKREYHARAIGTLSKLFIEKNTDI